MNATRIPTREPDTHKYTCQWCGVRVIRGHSTTPKSCKDCISTEIAFEGTR